MAIPALVNGRLPLGRWATTPGEVRDAFVGPGSGAVRRAIWDDWSRLTEVMREVVGTVPAAWLSGSFLTGKEEPGDLDCVYVVESSAMLEAWRDETQARFLYAVLTSQVKEAFGLKVDSYILEWMPTAGSGRSVGAERYLSDRGYWDDLWSRQRSTDLRQDAIPSRGYLEVILDGYV